MRRVLRILGRLVLAVVVLVLLVYVGNGIFGIVDAAQGRRDAREQLEQALPEAQRTAADRVEAKRAELAAGPPTHRWSQVRCEAGTDEAGWMVQRYVNACSFTHVEVIPTQGPPTAECQLVSPAEDAYSPEPVGLKGPGTTCLPEGGPHVRVVSGERPGQLDATRQWLVVLSSDERFVRTTIGCSRWSVLFCTEPGGLPVLPEG